MTARATAMQPQRRRGAPRGRRIDLLPFLQFIDSYTRRYQRPPHYREMSEGLGLTSLTPVRARIDYALNEKLITFEPFVARSVALTDAGRTYLRRGGAV